MRKVFYPIIDLLLSMALNNIGGAQSISKWVCLFKGKLVANLRGYKISTFPKAAWKVENGALMA